MEISGTFGNLRTFSICLTHLHVQTLTCTMAMRAEHSIKMQYSMCKQSPIMKQLIKSWGFLLIPRDIFRSFRFSRLATSMKSRHFAYTPYLINTTCLVFLCSMFNIGEEYFKSNNEYLLFYLNYILPQPSTTTAVSSVIKCLILGGTFFNHHYLLYFLSDSYPRSEKY